MELKNVLNQLTAASAGTTKTASADTPPTTKTAAAQKELVAALGSALDNAGSEGAVKTADDHSASDALTKIAGDLAAADKEALIKEANVYGAAVMDGFVARGMQYGLSLDGAEKTAAAGNGEEPTQADFEKWARENPEEFAKQFQAGHAAVTDQVKTAQAAEYEKWAATPEGKAHVAAQTEEQAKHAAVLEKLASTPEGREKIAAFEASYAETMSELEKVAGGDDSEEKLASVKKGFEEGTAAIEKLAQDYYTRGFNDTAALLSAR